MKNKLLQMSMYTQLHHTKIAIKFQSYTNIYIEVWLCKVLLKMSDHILLRPCPVLRRKIYLRIQIIISFDYNCE